MTFTLVSHLREQLSQLVRSKLEEQRQRESEKERLALEARYFSFVQGEKHYNLNLRFRQKKNAPLARL